MSISDKNQLIVDKNTKMIKNYYSLERKTLEQIYTEVLLKIEHIKNEKIFTDVEYTFQSGVGVIQVRNETDLRNIQVNCMEAFKDIMDGNPNKQHVFMDKNNIIREMTAQEMVNMASYVKNIGQQIYSSSWNHKYVNLKSIYENDNLTDDQKIDQILNYDITLSW